MEDLPKQKLRRIGSEYASDPEVRKTMQSFLPKQELITEINRKSFDMLREFATGETSIPPMMFVAFRQLEGDKPGPVLVEHHIFNTGFENAESKERLMRMLGKRLMDEQKFLVSVTLVNEVWMSMARPGGAYIEPSKDPQRKECILACTLSINHLTCTHILDTKRDEHNNMVFTGEPDVRPDSDPFILNYVFEGYADAAPEGVKEKLRSIPGAN